MSLYPQKPSHSQAVKQVHVSVSTQDTREGRALEDHLVPCSSCGHVTKAASGIQGANGLCWLLKFVSGLPGWVGFLGHHFLKRQLYTCPTLRHRSLSPAPDNPNILRGLNLSAAVMGFWVEGGCSLV